MKINRKTGLYVLAGLLILVIGYGFIPDPVLVETAEVKRAKMMVSIEEEGKTRVINRFAVSAPVAGYALRINLDVGDTVSRGMVITELEPLRSVALDPRSLAEAKASVSASEAALRSVKENALAAKSDAGFAEKEFIRIEQLYKEGLVTQGMLDAAEAEKLRAEAGLRSSDFAVEVARYEKEAALTALQYSDSNVNGAGFGKVVVRAPVSGSILEILHESEGVVREGQALIEIGDPKALEVEVDVLSADAVRIKPGTPVVFERWGGEGVLSGKVRVIEPAGFTKISALGVEEQRVLVISDITSPAEKWRGLGVGYRVEAMFILWEAPDVLQVPANALFRRKDGWSVFMTSNNRAYLREVQVGYRNGLSAQIVSGLNEGDRVITHPDSSIEDGIRVRLRQN